MVDFRETFEELRHDQNDRNDTLVVTKQQAAFVTSVAIMELWLVAMET